MSLLRQSAVVLSLLSLLSLSYGQTAPSCSSAASAVVIPATYASFTFGQDPRGNNAASEFNYSWLQQDSADVSQNIATYHQGLLLLNGGVAGSNANYVNLSASTGPNSIGGSQLPIIGGASQGSLAQSTYGWTVELTFKASSINAYAKLFDFGNPQVGGVCRDDILFGWFGGGGQMSFDYCDGNGVQYQVVPPYLFSAGVWYHVMVSIQALVNSDGSQSSLANYYIYINGQLTMGQAGSGAYPNAVTRANADIGKSSWNDAYWGGELDSLNFYNYALNGDQANALYLNATAGCAVAAGTAQPSANWITPSSAAAPAPTPVYSVFGSGYSAPSGTAYTYLTADPNDNNGAGCNIQSYHSGIVQLGGVSTQYVNLSAASGPYSAGTTTLPQLGGLGTGQQAVSGGSAGWTFEFWVKPLWTTSYAKLFDFAQPFSGTCHYDILAGWLGSGPTWQFSTCDGNGNSWNLNNIANGGVTINSWLHFTIVLAIHPTNASWSNYYAYANGYLTASTPLAYSIEKVPRPNADLGRSSWAADSYFDGLINFFNVYDKALSGPQVLARFNAISASGSIATQCPIVEGTLSTIPAGTTWFSATFDSNPAAGNAAVTGYGWQSVDDGDSTANQLLHKGLLTLDGISQYVNLSSATGNNSIGQTVPSTGIGGPGTGAVVQGSEGWSWEVVYKSSTQRPWAKLFDFGTPGPACVYDIVFGWDGGSSSQMTFSACDGNGNGFPGSANNLPAFTTITLNTWYHAVLTVAVNVQGGGLYSAYLNGVLQQAVNATYYLSNAPRVNADLGRSDWGDANWQGEIDTFRIYSMALNPNQVTTLYNAAMTSSTPPPNNAPSCSSAASAVVIPATYASFTFGQDPRGNNAASEFNYSWLQQDSADVSQNIATYHQGLLLLNGGVAGSNANYVNLSASTGPNSIGGSQLPIIGGASQGSLAQSTYGWTVELTFKASSINAYAKLFDFGNPQVGGVCRDDILFGWFGGGGQMSFDYCDGNGVQYQVVPPYLFSAGVWYHVMVSIQALVNSDGSQSSLANYYIYINGQLTMGQAGSGAYPNAVTRANADIGKSSWNDAYWGGELDSLNFYNYALNGDQANALYLNATAGCAVAAGTAQPSANWITPSSAAAPAPTPVYSVFGSGYSAPSGTAYTYLTADPNDNNGAGCNIQSYHSGIVQLGGVSTQYVNLSAASGPYSAGTTTLPQLGGLGTGQQAVSGGSAGWTFEFWVKPLWTTSYAKLFDFAQPFSGTCHYDILAGWLGSGPTWQFSTCDGNGNSWNLNNIANGGVTINSWLHFTIVLAIHPTNASWSNYYAYANGYLTASTPLAYSIEKVPRPNADLGRSSWAADSYFDGLINFFNVYDKALSGPQVLARFNAISASGSIATQCPIVEGTLSTIPAGTTWFSATFDSNPAAGNAAVTGYGWQSVDDGDSTANQLLHKGLLTLDGISQYVNLSSATGNNSIGQTVPSTGIGGPGTGAVVQGSEGWSWEVVYKSSTQRPWAKLFDFGTPGPACVYDIVFGWDGGSSSQMTFSACDGNGNGFPGSANNLPAFTTITLNTWYHAVLTVAVNVQGGGLYSAYLNGVLQQAVNATYYLSNAPRVNADLGRSDWGDANWQGEIDTFRIYSMALNPNQVTTLYNAAMTSSTPPPNNAPSCSSAASAVVIPATYASFTFGQDPRGNNAASEFNYSWLQQDSADVSQNIATYHQGLLLLNGGVAGSNANYVNLSASTGPNSIGGSQLKVIGGSSPGSLAGSTYGWSFEITFKASAVWPYAKIFDFGNPQVGGCVPRRHTGGLVRQCWPDVVRLLRQ